MCFVMTMLVITVFVWTLRVPMPMVAIVGMLMLFMFHFQVSMTVLTPLPMPMTTFLLQFLMTVRVMRVRASVVAARMLVAVQHAHDVEVTEQTKDRCPQHDLRLLHYILV